MVMIAVAVLVVLVLAGASWYYFAHSSLSAETKIAWNTEGNLQMAENATGEIVLSTTGMKFRFDKEGHILTSDGKRMVIALGLATHARLALVAVGKPNDKKIAVPVLTDGQSLLKYDITSKEIRADPVKGNVVNAYANGTVFMGPDAAGARTWRLVS